MMHSTTTSEASAKELLRHATEDTAELVRLEIALARDELRGDIAAAKSSLRVGAVAAALAVTGIALAAATAAVIVGPLVALVVAGVLLVTAGVLAAQAVQRFPSSPLAATAQRLKRDETLLKEHVS